MSDPNATEGGAEAPRGDGLPIGAEGEPPLEAEAGGAGNGHKGNGTVTAEDDDYIGYGRPPKRHQYKPGQSGNPKGRPTSARGLRTLLRKELTERVQITENGKARSISKMEFLIKRLVEKGSKGDSKSITKLIELGEVVFGMEDEEDRSAPLSAEDQAIVDGLMRRRSRSTRQAESPPKGDPTAKKENGEPDGEMGNG